MIIPLSTVEKRLDSHRCMREITQAVGSMAFTFSSIGDNPHESTYMFVSR